MQTHPWSKRALPLSLSHPLSLIHNNRSGMKVQQNKLTRHQISQVCLNHYQIHRISEPRNRHHPLNSAVIFSQASIFWLIHDNSSDRRQKHECLHRSPYFVER
jgi:hypothetical protein